MYIKSKEEHDTNKAELLQLNHTQFICRIKFANKKVGNRKDLAHYCYINLTNAYSNSGLSFFDFQQNCSGKESALHGKKYLL